MLRNTLGLRFAISSISGKATVRIARGLKQLLRLELAESTSRIGVKQQVIPAIFALTY